MSGIQVHVYPSVDDIPAEAWDALVPTDRVGLQRDHLRAMAASGINGHRPFYFLGMLDDEPVGVAHAVSLSMDLSALGDEVKPEIRSTLKAWYPGFMEFRLLEVGMISGLGEGILARPEHQEAFLEALVPALESVGAEVDADILFVRDVHHERYADFEPLRRLGFEPAQGFPAAEMDLRWEDFDGWLADLKSARRYNVRKKMKRFSGPGLSVEILPSFAEHADRLADLWSQVEARQSDYQHEQITADWFRAMDALGDKSEVIALKRGDSIVAMALCFLGDEEYFWAYVGLDDAYRLEYDLYFNLVFAGIRRAIETGRKKLALGITTYDFKTFVGGELVPQIYLFKHLKRPELSSAVADMFGESIEQPVNEKHSFGGEPPRRVTPAEVQSLIRPVPADPFHKIQRYTRTGVMKTAGVYAYFPEFESAQDPVVMHEGREVVMLGTNSYLGLATHPDVKQAAMDAIDRYGTGCSGSPAMNGTLDLHERLSEELAAWIGKDRVMLFSTGYQANLAAVSTLANRNDVIIMDQRNHASLIDGSRLGRAQVKIFKHNDMGHLEALLKENQGRPTLVVVDSLFSMEGTTINLPEVVRLKNAYGARLYVDESHAVGATGPTGCGLAEEMGLLDEVDVIMGTFSKSFASVGGFVAMSEALYQGLRHTARGHIFSASLPPSAVAAVRAALRIIKHEPERRQKLRDNAAYLASGLQRVGWPARHTDGAIVPVDIGDELLTLAVFHKLFSEGVFVNPVIFPGVPKGGELLRLAVMPTATREILDRAVAVFDRIRTPDFPRPSEALQATGS